MDQGIHGSSVADTRLVKLVHSITTFNLFQEFTDDDWTPNSGFSTTRRNLMPLTRTAVELVKYRISSQAAASILNAHSLDVNDVQKLHHLQDLIVDRHKVDR